MNPIPDDDSESTESAQEKSDNPEIEEQEEHNPEYDYYNSYGM